MSSVARNYRDNLRQCFIGKMYDTFQLYEAIKIKGKLKQDAQTVNICLKPLQKRDYTNLDITINIPKKKLHLGYMIENSLISGEYDDRFMRLYAPNKPGEVLLEPGSMFSVYIILTPHDFVIGVNDDRIFCYEYRQELFRATKIIEVNGDVEYVTAFDSSKVFPIPFPATQFTSPNVVFSMELSHQITPGTHIIVDALVDGPPDGMFVVYFPSSFRFRTLLWFGVDFATKTVGRKAMNVNMEYENEEYDGPFPFKLGEVCRMLFGFENNEFVMAVNGKSIPSYPYPVQIKDDLNEPMFNMLMGLKVYVKNGLKFEALATFIERRGMCRIKSKLEHEIIV